MLVKGIKERGLEEILLHVTSLHRVPVDGVGRLAKFRLETALEDIQQL